MRALILVALAACTYDEKIFEGPFTCIGQSPPVSAPAIVHLTGTVVDPLNRQPVIGAGVELQTAPGTTVTSIFTDGNGRFSFDLNTQGVPAVGFDLYAHQISFVDSYYFPPRPISGDVDTQISLLTMSESSTLFTTAGLTQATGDGNVLLSINDCIEPPLAGATLSSMPAGTVRYFTSVTPSQTATATDAAGVAMVANLPPGKAKLTAMAQGHTFAPLEVSIVANAFTVTELQP